MLEKGVDPKFLVSNCLSIFLYLYKLTSPWKQKPPTQYEPQQNRTWWNPDMCNFTYIAVILSDHSKIQTRKLEFQRLNSLSIFLYARIKGGWLILINPKEGYGISEFW